MREIDAIGKCVEALRGLNVDECERALRYLDDRFVVHRSPRDAQSLAPVVGAEGGACSNVPGPVVKVTESGSGHGVAGADASAPARASHDLLTASGRLRRFGELRDAGWGPEAAEVRVVEEEKAARASKGETT